MVHPLDATFENSLLLKIGESQSYSMKKGELAVFKFLTDEKQDLEVALNVRSGSVKASLSYSEDSKNSFDSLSGS